MLKTPLEDFTTEILVGILNTNKEIGDSFVNNVLKIEGTNFSINTQGYYCLNDDNLQDCRVDIVIKSDDILCFVENKVESKEGYVQLDRYCQVLDGFNPGVTTYLKYCTKYYDNKNIDRHNFHQYRWADVHRFLMTWQSSELISQYLDFLNEHDMSDNMDFSLNDLVVLQNLNPTVKKMERYIEKIKPIFTTFFDANKLKDPNNLKQIKQNSRYIFVAEWIFGQNGYTELGVGFGFDETPCVKVWIWCSQGNDKSKLFKDASLNTDFDLNSKDWLGLSKPLSDFVSAENIEQEIELWFAGSLSRLKDFTKATPQLDWHI